MFTNLLVRLIYTYISLFFTIFNSLNAQIASVTPNNYYNASVTNSGEPSSTDIIENNGGFLQIMVMGGHISPYIAWNNNGVSSFIQPVVSFGTAFEDVILIKQHGTSFIIALIIARVPFGGMGLEHIALFHCVWDGSSFIFNANYEIVVDRSENNLSPPKICRDKSGYPGILNNSFGIVWSKYLSNNAKIFFRLGVIDQTQPNGYSFQNTITEVPGQQPSVFYKNPDICMANTSLGIVTQRATTTIQGNIEMFWSKTSGSTFEPSLSLYTDLPQDYETTFSPRIENANGKPMFFVAYALHRQFGFYFKYDIKGVHISYGTPGSTFLINDNPEFDCLSRYFYLSDLNMTATDLSDDSKYEVVWTHQDCNNVYPGNVDYTKRIAVSKRYTLYGNPDPLQNDQYLLLSSNMNEGSFYSSVGSISNLLCKNAYFFMSNINANLDYRFTYKISGCNDYAVKTDLVTKHQNESKNSDKSDYEIYPNPGNRKFIITNLVNNDLALRIKIYDSKGKLVIERSDFKIGSSIDITHLRQGLFIVKIFESRKIVTKKLLIAR